MSDPTQRLTTSPGLRLDPIAPLGTFADTWEGGIPRIVAFRVSARVLLLILGYATVSRTFEDFDAALAAIDAEAGDLAGVFGEVTRGG